METQDILEKGVGTKELETLKPAQVVVTGIRIDKKEKNNKPIGEIATFICKHPDREQLIELGQVKYLKGDSVKYSGTWVNLDEDNNIQKGSALAVLLDFLKAQNLRALEGKEVSTDVDKNGYLCLKGY